MKKILFFTFVAFMSIFFAMKAKAIDKFDGLGLNYASINCNASGQNCIISELDKSFYSIPSSFNVNSNQFPSAPLGWTFNVYHSGFFEPSYIYTLDITLIDNASSLEYLRGWSVAITSGNGNYSSSNSYASLISAEFSRAGTNITYTIKFKALSNFDYLRINARAPFNLQTGRVYSDSTEIETSLFKNSLRRTGNFTFGIQGFTLKYEKDTTDTIINQNQTIINLQDKTNEKLDNIDDTLKDDSVDTNGANSFFDGFKDTEHGGISGIITSPLRFVNRITDKCTQIDFELFDNKISLPCGDTLFWNKSEVEEFRVFWNILVGGPIIYALLIKLFKVIENLKNPENSGVEVMKL